MSSSTRNKWRRFGYAISFLVVAGVAAYVSFGHIYEVALLAHQPRPLAVVIPLSVDGLMLIATLALGEDKAANRAGRTWARFAFWLGAVVSIAANIASTWVHYGPEPLALAVAGWAPIALLVAIEVVSKPGKPKAIEVATPAEELTVPSAAEMAAMPEAPVSPAPAASGRPRTPVKRTADGVVVDESTGRPVPARTSRRIRNQQPERLDG